MERHVRRTSGTALPRHTTSNQSNNNNNNNNRVASPYNTPDINQSRATISYGGGSPPISSHTLTSPVRRTSASSPTPHQTPHANAAKQKLQLPRSLSKQFSSDLDPYILRGLTLAGVIVYCLNTLFQLFHVDVFLTAYKLPSTTYSFGRLLFSFLSTTGSLYGAWWLDDVVAATRVRRSDVVGCLGLAVAVTFILPFIRFWTWHDTEWAWHILDGVHFVISMSLYDTLATILSISLASAVSDDHNMTDAERVANMSSSQVYSLVASLVVATIGLQVFDAHRLQHFQYYVVVIAILSVASFGMAQSIITGKYLEMQGRHDKSHHRLFHIWKGWTVAVPKDLLMAKPNSYQSNMNGDNAHPDDTTTMQSTTTNRNESMSPIRQRAGGGGPHRQTSNASSSSNQSTGNATNSNNHLGSASKQRNSAQQQQTNQKLAWRRALRDLWHHTNFIRWIFLEMLLELQTHFLQTFFKTFLDRLLTDIPHEVADWSLSLLRPMCQVVTILIYLPIKWYGYAKVYTTGLALLWILASGMWLFVTPSSTVALFSFLSVYTIGLEGLRQAGFYLVMSDLVLELKQSYAQQGRWDEPSLAGLLLGATTMVCKPMQSVLPIVAATLLDKYSAPDAEDAEDTLELYHEAARTVLYYLLVIPPWVCSLLQLWVWRDYDLHPRRTKEIRVELQEYVFYRPSTERDDTLLPTANHHGDNSAETIMVRNKSHNEMVPLATSSYDSDHPAQRRRHYQNHSSSNTSLDNSSGRLSAVI